MLARILIANRGEIACRIIRTCRRLGIRAVAVYSDADRDALHVASADEAVRIGPAPAADSYLDAAAVLAAASACGADAIHPGYGFLSESAAFARACAEAGVVFVGPPPEAIALMGEKDRAREHMAAAGLPIVPGHHEDAADDRALGAAAARLGFPVMLKAAAGGGGKGMRVVRAKDALAEAVAACRREARAAFGDDRLLLERFIASARHVEVQVFGDRDGNVVHMFERDCSLQRRHQKVIEEAPAPGLGDDLRRALGEAAVRAAAAVGYVGAGTVEFLLAADGSFYFMEMNTRLQVEHPVTEMVTGLDLVEWQLRVAAGEPLPLRQDAIRLRGHAVEARVYAEDPLRGFLPSAGRLERLRLPQAAPALRVETGVREGDLVSAHYDPMIAKLVAFGEDRVGALRALRRALAASAVLGPATNLAFLEAVLDHPAVEAGGVDTGFLERQLTELVPGCGLALEEQAALACLRLLLDQREAAARARASFEPHSPWHRVDGWRLNDRGHQTWRLRLGERLLELRSEAEGDGWRLQAQERSIRLHGRAEPEDWLYALIDGRALRAIVMRRGEDICGVTELGRFVARQDDPIAAAAREEEAQALFAAPMPGRVVRVLVRAGEQVARGAGLLVLEAMKMEHRIEAPADGRVTAVHVEDGARVEEGVVLLDFEPLATPASPGEAA